MNPSIKLGRVAGVPLGVNWSWLVVFALIAWSLATAVFPSQDPGLAHATYIWMGIAAAVVFFASLLAHELGHALAARREGMVIEGITLWLFGGVARFKGMFPSAGAEFRIAIAGPLVSLGLGLGFVALAVGTHFTSPVDGIFAWLGYINLLLLAFNLLPALPLDGGRILRALLWKWGGDLGWATRIAADTGRAFGFLLIGGGIALFILHGAWSGAWLAFVGWFLLTAAIAEARLVAVRELLGGLRVRDLMVRKPVTLRADETLAEAVDELASLPRHATYPVTENSHVLGLASFDLIVRFPRDQWDTHRVRECLLPPNEVPVVREDDELGDTLATLSESPAHRALVIDGGRLVGLLSLADIGQLAARGKSRTT